MQELFQTGLWTLAVGVVFVSIVGCNDTPDAGGGGVGGTGATTGGTGGVGGSSPVTLFISVEEPTQSGEVPLEGVRICELDTDRCVTTDESGTTTLEFPKNSEIAYVAEKEGYASLLTHDVTDETFGGFAFEVMYTHDAMAEWAAQVGVDYPFTSGILGMATLPPIQGLTFELLGHSDRPFYYDEAGGYSHDHDQASGDRGYPAPFGEGGFAGIVDGEYEVEFHGTGDLCTGLSFGWPGSGPNRIRIPVRAGYVSYASLRCGEE